MGNIYETASCDLLWLGEDVGLSSEVTKLLITKFETEEELRRRKHIVVSGGPGTIVDVLYQAESAFRFAKELEKIFFQSGNESGSSAKLLLRRGS